MLLRDLRAIIALAQEAKTLLPAALRILADDQPGYPTSSIPEPSGKGNISDRTGTLGTGPPDPASVCRDVIDSELRTAAALSYAPAIAKRWKPGRVNATRLEADGRYLAQRIGKFDPARTCTRTGRRRSDQPVGVQVPRRPTATLCSRARASGW